MSRQHVALGEPGDRDLTGLPRHELTSEQLLYRAHQSDLSPWWYASDENGRFNLPEPHGTCYLATDRASAVREVAGESLVALGYISAEFSAGRVVSTLKVAGDHELADLAHTDAARFGITREISTCVPYEIPQAWARAIRRHGFNGIRYLARFSTGAGDVGLAIFGDAGQQDSVTDVSSGSFADAARECGIEVVPNPKSVRIVDPPGL